nr:MAG TPA: hypothetical protein [Caudoviricetes sp.]
MDFIFFYYLAIFGYGVRCQIKRNVEVGIILISLLAEAPILLRMAQVI